jgi:hypothetical protein
MLIWREYDSTSLSSFLSLEILPDAMLTVSPSWSASSSFRMRLSNALESAES